MDVTGAALRERLLEGRTASEIETAHLSAAVTGEGLPIYAWLGVTPPLRCSLGCHALPDWARFDPHNGRPLSHNAEGTVQADGEGAEYTAGAELKVRRTPRRRTPGAVPVRPAVASL